MLSRPTGNDADSVFIQPKRPSGAWLSLWLSFISLGEFHFLSLVMQKEAESWKKIDPAFPRSLTLDGETSGGV